MPARCCCATTTSPYRRQSARQRRRSVACPKAVAAVLRLWRIYAPGPRAERALRLRRIQLRLPARPILATAGPIRRPSPHAYAAPRYALGHLGHSCARRLPFHAAVRQPLSLSGWAAPALPQAAQNPTAAAHPIQPRPGRSVGCYPTLMQPHGTFCGPLGSRLRLPLAVSRCGKAALVSKGQGTWPLWRAHRLGQPQLRLPAQPTPATAGPIRRPSPHAQAAPRYALGHLGRGCACRFTTKA